MNRKKFFIKMCYEDSIIKSFSVTTTDETDLLFQVKSFLNGNDKCSIQVWNPSKSKMLYWLELILFSKNEYKLFDINKQSIVA